MLWGLYKSFPCNQEIHFKFTETRVENIFKGKGKKYWTLLNLSMWCLKTDEANQTGDTDLPKPFNCLCKDNSTSKEARRWHEQNIKKTMHIRYEEFYSKLQMINWNNISNKRRIALLHTQGTEHFTIQQT